MKEMVMVLTLSLVADVFITEVVGISFCSYITLLTFGNLKNGTRKKIYKNTTDLPPTHSFF
jgi:hypothetical protein